MKTTPTVPRLWPESTVVCLGTGPSLTPADVDFCRERARVIAVNDAYTIAPWADCLYAADGKWWKWHKGAPGFVGMKYSIEPHDAHKASAVMLKNLGRPGLSLDPAGLCLGTTANSGYQAINLAVHFGARRILLLGYDMRGSHFFGVHPDNSLPRFERVVPGFQTLVAPLAALGVTVINCTPRSALTCFPRAALRDALEAVAA